MKTFKDLEFISHLAGSGEHGTLFFPNGYGISVIQFTSSIGIWGSYTSNENEWEIAVLYGDRDSYRLTYDTQITDDVIGHLSEEEVTEIMEKIQSL